MSSLLLIAAALQPVWVGQFAGSGAPPAPWRVVQISRKVPPTQFRRQTVAGVPAIEARANRSMALLARPAAIDLFPHAGAVLALAGRCSGRQRGHDQEKRRRLCRTAVRGVRHP